MKKGLFLLIGVLTLSLSLTGCVPETTEEEDANTSEIVQTDALDTNTTEDSSSLEEDNETSLIADESDSSTTYDLVAYMLPTESVMYAYDEYDYIDDELDYTSIGAYELNIEISGNDYSVDNSFDTKERSYNDTYFSIEDEIKRYMAIGDTYTSPDGDTCTITAHHDSYTYPLVEGYTYTDVLEETCTYSDDEEEVDKYKIYHAKGIGMVAEIDDDCYGDDGLIIHDDWSASLCASTEGYHSLLQID